MLLNKIKVFRSHGKQVIPKLEDVELPEIFRGRVEIKSGMPDNKKMTVSEICPSGAITQNPFSIDLGKCMFCGECAIMEPDFIRFTNDYHLATNVRERLIIKEDCFDQITIDEQQINPDIKRLFSRALKLRQVSAGGDNCCEMELNASGNVNFDFGRYGVEFTASPRHCDGMVITGPISDNMAIPMELCYNSIPDPKIIILAGSDAISGGVHAESKAINRSFLNRYKPDLYIPGNPLHPLSFIHGIMNLTGRKF